MNVIDTLQIPFPKSIEELTALDATRETPYLKALCNRRHIHVPGPNPTPAQIIPTIEQRLRDHDRSRPDPRFPKTDLTIEWTAIAADLTEFLTQLRALAPKKVGSAVLACTASAGPRAHNSHPNNQEPSNVKTTSSSRTSSPSFSTNPTPASQSAIRNPRSAIDKSSGHFNKLSAPAPKSPAISTNPPKPSKTLGHFNHLREKNPSTSNPTEFPIGVQTSVAKNSTASPIPGSQSQSTIPSPQSEISNLKSEISHPTSSSVLSVPSVVNNPAAPTKRRNDPILSSLTPDQKQQLIHLYEQHEAIDASRLAAEKLNLHISPSTLSRLYATWRIQEDQDAINDLAATYSDPSAIRASQSALASLTEQQLQLRLLELANRPNLDPAELRAICHSFARLQSLKLADRRVQLAESKEARLAQATQSDGPFSLEAYNQAIDVMFGRDPRSNDDDDFNSQENTEPLHEMPGKPEKDYDEPFNPEPSSEEPAPVGPAVLSGPRTDQTLPPHQYESNASLPSLPSACNAPQPSPIVDLQSSLPNPQFHHPRLPFSDPPA